jgi:hypothetical protein
MKSLTINGPRTVIDLGDDSKAMLPIRRRLYAIGVVLLVAMLVTLALGAIGVAGEQGIHSGLITTTLFLFLYATLFFYLADVPRGNLAAIRGMIVGGGGASAWLGWDCAWVTSTFHPGLGLLGMGVGFLAGAMFGAIAGVFLGSVKRSVLRFVAGPPDAIPVEKGFVRDGWLDEA